MKKSRLTDSQIIDALKQAESGLAVPDVCRELGIRVDVVISSRTPKQGIGWLHPQAAARHGRITRLLLNEAKKGGYPSIS